LKAFTSKSPVSVSSSPGMTGRAMKGAIALWTPSLSMRLAT
jgi:hypothetical protein